MKQLTLKTAGTDEDIAVRFGYKLFCGVEMQGARGYAVTLTDFKRLCKRLLCRREKESQYRPEDIRCMFVHFSDGRRFIWQAPSLTRFGTWTKTWQQVNDAEKWSPTDYGLMPF